MRHDGLKQILFLSSFFLIFTFAASGIVTAEIYKFYDENGVLHLTDKPPQGKVKNVATGKSNQRQAPKAYHTPSELKTRFNGYVDSISQNYQIDPHLVRAVIQVESNYNHLAVSPKGAQGLMQIMPDTAKRFGVKNPLDPYTNIEGGVKYLKYLFRIFEDDLELILASYNCGENRVKDTRTIPEITETKEYVKKVLNLYYDYRTKSPQTIVKYVDERGILNMSNRPAKKK